jgi:protein PsiE
LIPAQGFLNFNVLNEKLILSPVFITITAMITLKENKVGTQIMMKKPFHAIEEFGNVLMEGFHLLGLLIVGVSILWASWSEIFHIIDQGGPGIKDVLLLFIYLELGAMVGIYFKTKRMPVRFLIYIAITALTRVLAIDIKTMDDMHMLALTGSILVLSLSVLVLKVGSDKFPSNSKQDNVHQGLEADT